MTQLPLLLEPACVCDGCDHEPCLAPVGAAVFMAYALTPENGYLELVEREVGRVEFDDADDPLAPPGAMCDDCHGQIVESWRWHAARRAA